MKIKNIIIGIIPAILIASGVFAMTASFQGVPVPTSFPSYLTASSTATASSTWISSSTLYSNLNLGTIATHPTTDYLASSTTYVSTFNGSSGAVTGVGSLSSANGLVTLNNSTGTITLTASTTPTFSNIADSGIAANSFIATDANHNLIATTTPSGGGLTSINNGTGASNNYNIVPGNSMSYSTSTATTTLNAKSYPISFIIENPTASENDAIFIFNATSTINSCSAVNKTLGDTLTWNVGYSSNRSTATSSLYNLFSSAQTTTATTTPSILTINASSTPGANNPLIFWTSGTASSTQFSLTCTYSIN